MLRSQISQCLLPLLQSSPISGVALAALHGDASCQGVRWASSLAVAQGTPSSSSSSTRLAESSSRPHRALWPAQQRASEAYQVSLLIKGFELRFVKQASTVIRDLMLLCFTPKSIYSLPDSLRDPWTGAPKLGSVRGGPVALALPLGDRPLRTRRTVFTVIRGPHVHKTSREQFQRLVHRRAITYPTNSHEELQWFLDALKTYDFKGVQIQVRLGSRTFLSPPPPEEAVAIGPGAAAGGGAAAGPRPLLADHMARFPHLFPAAALGGGAGAGAAAPVAAAPSSSMAAEFESLRGAARAELLSERLALHSSDAYDQWLRQQDRSSLAATADAAAAAEGAAAGGLAAIGRAVAREVERAAAVAGGASGTQPGAAALRGELAAAAAKVLADRGLAQELSG